MDNRDWELMGLALASAQRAFDVGEVPVGAVIVDAYGAVLAQDHNYVEAASSQTEHAEVRALRAAGIQRGTWRLDRCTVYVTLEPCMMCISAIALSRIERIVYGCASPLYGYTLDAEGIMRSYVQKIRCIESGLRAKEAEALLQRYFHDLRQCAYLCYNTRKVGQIYTGG